MHPYYPSSSPLTRKKIVRQGDTWQIPVVPNKIPARLSDLYNQLADLEIEMQEKFHMNVNLIPDYPMDAS